MRNFDRHYEFTFFDIDAGNTITPVTNVKIADSFNFSFDYSVTTSNFNTANFKFYNLPSYVSDLFTSTKNRKGFYFRAVYDDIANIKNNTIFQGLTYRVNSYREGTDIITDIIACDPYFNLQFARIKTINSASGTTAVSLLQKVSDYLGTFNSVSGTEFLSIKPIYNIPLSFSNVSITVILDMVTKDNSCTWSYDKNGIRISPNQTHPNFSALASRASSNINNRSGLIGSVKPETISVQMLPIDYFTQQKLSNNLPYVTVTVLLRPFSLYDLVNLEVENKELSGKYLIVGITYTGEFRGNSWYAVLKLSPSIRSF